MKMFVVCILFMLLTCTSSSVPEDHEQAGVEDRVRLQRFSSYEELKDFVKASSEISSFDVCYFPTPSTPGWYWRVDGAPLASPGVAFETVSSDAAGFEFTIREGTALRDYSSTNIQVEGVDEADMVKTDGEYIYIVSEGKVFIVYAYPPEEAEVLSEIEFGEIVDEVFEIFKNGNKLVVFGSYRGVSTDLERRYAIRRWTSRMFVKIYDITDKENPVLERNLMLDGEYFSSRMIGNHIYVVVNAPVMDRDGEVYLPVIRSNGAPRTVSASEVYHFKTFDFPYRYTIVLSINLLNGGEWSSRVFLVGETQNIFVSAHNIYVTRRKGLDTWGYWNALIDETEELLPTQVRDEIRQIENSGLSEMVRKTKEVMLRYYENLSDEEKREFRREFGQKVRNVRSGMHEEATVIHRISISGGEIRHEAEGEVPGRVLNQFSMDEYNGYFRIATTTGQVWGWGDETAKNHVYVLDEDLNVVGRLENLAPGERIYSARFMRKRAYLVTFKKVDPLFVIDLEDPFNPKVLGELKIPGYSDYLHPYDENHLIGIGKDTIESEWGDFAWFQGVKLSLFDVSDPNDPKEISTYVIGKRGTESPALHDHRAFLFSREKNLLVIPVSVVENETDWWRYDYDWEGAYVFEISPENGIVFRGGVEHPGFSVKRSLYIEEVLYTISDGMVKMNSLTDLSEINSLLLA